MPPVPAPPVEPVSKRPQAPEPAPKVKEPSPELTLILADHLPLESVLIPAGKTILGSPEDEAGRNSDEGPAREVVFRTPFYMGRFEVTQEQYEAVMGRNPSQFKGVRRPVESVTSFDAQEFCERVTKRAGRDVRLPTETEWEYACRGRASTPFSTGAHLDSTEANIDGRVGYAGVSAGAYRGKTLDVGSFAPNAFGLYDMHGNVGEWCLDYLRFRGPTNGRLRKPSSSRPPTPSGPGGEGRTTIRPGAAGPRAGSTTIRGDATARAAFGC